MPDSDEPDPNEAEERKRHHERMMAEDAARHKAELEQQQHEHEREMARIERAHQSTLATQQSTQQAAQQDRAHKVAWYGTVWVPVVLAAAGGFLGGLVALGNTYLQRDVRNQVWQATYEDKQRASQLQSELLKLQEDYIGKLKQLQEGEAALAKANTELQHKQVEAQALKDESKRALEALRARYGGLEAAERARVARLNADKAAVARREPWRMHGCLVAIVLPTGVMKNECGNRITFAKDTPDEKVVVQPNKLCLDVQGAMGRDDYDSELARCKVYGRTFLTGKGLTVEDADAILDDYSFRTLFGDRPAKR